MKLSPSTSSGNIRLSSSDAQEVGGNTTGSSQPRANETPCVYEPPRRVKAPTNAVDLEAQSLADRTTQVLGDDHFGDYMSRDAGRMERAHNSFARIFFLGQPLCKSVRRCVAERQHLRPAVAIQLRRLIVGVMAADDIETLRKNSRSLCARIAPDKTVHLFSGVAQTEKAFIGRVMWDIFSCVRELVDRDETLEEIYRASSNVAVCDPNELYGEAPAEIRRQGLPNFLDECRRLLRRAGTPWQQGSTRSAVCAAGCVLGIAGWFYRMLSIFWIYAWLGWWRTGVSKLCVARHILLNRPSSLR